MRSRRSRVPVGLVLAGLSAALWFFFAPAQLGGSTSFTATVGTSMEPMFHKGDLAVTRRASTYRVGDVALYNSPVFQRPVLHRIVAVQHGHYFFKGDNNEFVDPGYVTRGELLGKLAFHLAGAGNVLNWFGKPSHSALLAAMAVLAFVFGGTGKAVRRRRGKRRRHGKRDSPAGRAPVSISLSLAGKLHRPRKTPENIGAGVLGVLALVLIVAGFTSPVKKTVQVSGAYRHGGTFSYTARVIRPVSTYPTGIAHAGEPLFLNSFRTLNVGFSYRFGSRLAHSVRGTIALTALISSDTNWHRRYTLGKASRFAGDKGSVHGTLDLHELQALISQLAVESGAIGAQYHVELLPIVRVHGVVGDKRIAEKFTPTLPLTLSQSVLTLNLSAPVVPPGATYALPSVESVLQATLNPSQAGSVPGFAPGYVSIARYRLPVSQVRGIGLGLAALALLLLASKLLKPKREVWSLEKRIAFRYESVIVDVVSITDGSLSSGRATEIPDFESLATLARYCERPILRETHGGAHTYAVEDGGRLYVYRAAPVPEPAVIVPAPEIALKQPTAGRVLAPSSRSWRPRSLLRPAGLLLVVAVGATFITAFTAANTVPISYIGTSLVALQVPQLAPLQCAGLTPTNLMIATTATTTGTAGNDLILGKNAAGALTIKGGTGDDCIVGGGGAGTTNTLDGGAGTNNICIGSPGATNTFKNCATTY
jgi:signal peptidase I